MAEGGRRDGSRAAAIVATALGLAAFLLYLPTVAPTVTLRNGGGDSGELVRAAWTLGVPHPTGYPLWVILAHLATLIPAGEPAHRVALLSALAAAGAVTFVFLLAREALHQAAPESEPAITLLAPATGAACLAVSVLFWQQATIPETYAFDSFLVAMGLWLLLRWLRGAQPLWVVTAVAALALANHLISVTLLIAIGVGILIRTPRPSGRDLGLAIGPFPATIAFYLFLMARARMHPLANWGDPQTPGALWFQVTAGEYRHFLTSRSIGAMVLELGRWPGRLRQQFTVFGAVAAVWSLLTLLARAWRAGLVLLTALVVDLAIVVRDAAPAGPAYLHVAYLVLAAALGAGLALIPRSFTSAEPANRIVSLIACFGGVVLAAALAWQTRPAVNLHGDYSLEQVAHADLVAVPAGGLLLTEGDNPLFALWYLQDVLGERPDVIIWSLNLVFDPWYGQEMHARYPAIIPADLPLDEMSAADRVIVANLRTRAVVSTADQSFLSNRYQVQKIGPLYRLVGLR